MDKSSKRRPRPSLPTVPTDDLVLGVSTRRTSAASRASAQNSPAPASARLQSPSGQPIASPRLTGSRRTSVQEMQMVEKEMPASPASARSSGVLFSPLRNSLAMPEQLSSPTLRENTEEEAKPSGPRPTSFIQEMNAPRPDSGARKRRQVPSHVRNSSTSSVFSETGIAIPGQSIDGNIVAPTAPLSSRDAAEIHRYRQLRVNAMAPQLLANETTHKKGNIMEQGRCGYTWSKFARIITGFIPNVCLAKCSMTEKAVQQAWREKIALCLLSLILCGLLAFITFGLQSTVCITSQGAISHAAWTSASTSSVLIHGQIYDLNTKTSGGIPYAEAHRISYGASVGSVMGTDVSALFVPNTPNCDALGLTSTVLIPCKTNCHSMNDPQVQIDMANIKIGRSSYEYAEIPGGNLVVMGSNVIDITSILKIDDAALPANAKSVLQQAAAYQDATFFLRRQDGDLPRFARCLQETHTIGYINTASGGCIFAQALLYVSLVLILGMLVIRFFFAIFFQWLLSHKLGMLEERRKLTGDGINTIGTLPKRSLSVRKAEKKAEQAKAAAAAAGVGIVSSAASATTLGSRNSAVINRRRGNSSSSSSRYSASTLDGPRDLVATTAAEPTIPAAMLDPNRDAYVILLVTCYSEDEAGLRITLDSLAATNYPDDHKMILIVADGMIKGAGNAKTTPEVCIDMIDLDPNFPAVPDPCSYVAIADGQKRFNMGQVYAGHYKSANGHVVPTVLVVKCGGPQEANQPKAGNRGKRDSQIILMNFLSKIMFDERLTSLEFDLFNKMRHIMGVTPDMFEIVLMVDADTKVHPDSLSRMVSVMKQDPQVMGLCGETRISNKMQSWVTMIQVFEYYISHHLTKAFESMFGTVTCLPGCFCMYRIKAPKNGFWIPILANPDILEQYSENVVDTLHKKNLLLLGEDRYLTTLMLRTFPKRKMMFVPRAICKTEVPSEFKVLLSQRRRWINSTIHNLLELVLVQELCGTFCFSMQFLIFMELIGTATLPAAICFTIALVVIAIVGPVIPTMPLILLGAILGLPALLVLFTTRRISYIGWCVVYILALPIWNFVLPVYSFWHFDDFSWGATRQVSGVKESKAGHSGDGSTVEISDILHLRWSEWEKERRRRSDSKLLAGGEAGHAATTTASSSGRRKASTEGASASMA